MKNPLKVLVITFFLSVLFITNCADNAQALVSENNPESYYREKAIHSRDGIGKFYMGREIAQVMGHQAMICYKSIYYIFHKLFNSIK